MVELTKYLNNNPGFGTYLETCERPIQAIHRVNPELASIIHYDAEKGLNPQLVPLLRDFRRAERDEKIATLRAIERMYATDANERMHEGELITAKELARMGYGTKKYEIDSTERMHRTSARTALDLKGIEKLMHGKRIGVDSEGIASDERRDRYGIDADVYKHGITTAAGIEEVASGERRHNYSVDAEKDMHNSSLEARTNLARLRKKMLDAGIDLEESRILSDEKVQLEGIKANVYKHELTSAADERRHNSSLIANHKLAQLRIRMLDAEIELEESRILSTERMHSGSTQADVYKHELTTAADERRHNSSLIANHKLAQLRKRMLDAGIELEESRILSDERRHIYTVDAQERMAMDSAETRKEVVRMSLANDRYQIDSAERRHTQEQETERKGLELLKGAIEDQQLMDLIKLIITTNGKKEE